MALDAVTLENDKVVSFSRLDNFFELMEAIVLRSQVVYLIVPYYFCLSGLKFNSLADCILEIEN